MLANNFETGLLTGQETMAWSIAVSLTEDYAEIDLFMAWYLTLSSANLLRLKLLLKESL